MKTGRDTGYRNGVHKTKTNFQTSIFYAVFIHCQHYLNIFLSDLWFYLRLFRDPKATLIANATAT